jgi:hypothetical protein
MSMSFTNDFLYSYECSVTGTDVTILTGTQSALPTSPVALAEQTFVNGELSGTELGYFEGTDSSTTGFTYVGTFTQGGVIGVVVQTSDGFFVYSDGILTDGDGTSDGETVTTFDNATAYVLCFCGGTEIATPSGIQKIEDLRIGDLVEVVGKAPQEIRWIGRQLRMIDHSKVNTPIKVNAGALSEGVPSKDLFVSPDHAIFFDGLLATARSLVNNDSVTWVDEIGELVEFFHIELDNHELLIANNTPAESFLDEIPRSHFDNWREWVELNRQTMSCEPLPYLRVKSRRQLPSKIFSAIADRALLIRAER